MNGAIEILLVEDEPAKAERIVATLTKAVAPIPVKFACAAGYEEARDALKADCFDVVLLDLHIPGALQMPSPNFAIALLQDLVKGVLNSPTHVIGLTQHEESALQYRSAFDQHMFHLQVFSHFDTQWAQAIADKLRYAFDAQRAVSRYCMSRSATDMLVVTARYANEFAPITQEIVWAGEAQDKHVMFPGMRIRHGTVATPGGEQKSLVVACFEEMGIAAAAAHSTQLIQVFRPRLATMLGMCCAFRGGGKSAYLNDVILTEEASCWDEGKYLDGGDGGEDGDDVDIFLSRAKTITLRHPLAGYLNSFVERRSEALSKDLSRLPMNLKIARKAELSKYSTKAIKLRPGRLLSGLNVVSNKELVDEIVKRSPSALGLDMETYGVFKAAASSPLFQPHFLSFKGVADFGVGKVNNIFDPVQKTASVMSYKVFWDFVSFLESETDFWKH